MLGSYGDDDKGTEAGSAYVYASGSPPQLLAKLMPVDGTGQEKFGTSVAAGGNGLVVVGAPWDQDETLYQRGSAFVYRVNAVSTILLGKLYPGGSSFGDLFGNSVAADSTGLIVIGAPHDDTITTDSGAAYVYRVATDGSAPALVAKLHSPASPGHDKFGWSVAIADGLVVISAPFEDDSVVGGNVGAVYVFRILADDSSQLVGKIMAGDRAYDDQLGSSVAVGLDGMIVAGSYRNDVGSTESGAAYVYQLGSDDSLTMVAKLVPSDPSSYKWFGYAVATSGAGLVTVGAINDNSGKGAVYAYNVDAATNSAVQVKKIAAADAVSGSYFGSGVAIGGPAGVALAGAPGDDDKGSYSGAAYAYSQPITALT